MSRPGPVLTIDMSAFAGDSDDGARPMPVIEMEQRLALPAA